MLNVTSFLKTKMVDFYYCSDMISWSYQKEGSSYALNDILSFKKSMWQYTNTNTQIHTNTLFSLIQFIARVPKKGPKWNNIIKPENLNLI